MNSNEITADALREILDYESATGVFTWRKKTSHRVEVGEIAGCRDVAYIKIQIKGSKYLAHRLAWLHTYGEWPGAELDHRNGDGFDNRIANLRNVSHSENMQNQRRAKSNNTSGLLGANRQGRGYQSSINIKGKPTYIGYFKSAQDAHQAYLEAKHRHHPMSSLGD